MTKVTAAIFGLLGVIVGGVLNGAITWTIERSRERRESRTAARLLFLELRNARGGFNSYAVAQGWEWPHAKAMKELLLVLEDEVWRTHRGTMARVLDGAGWRAVSNAYYWITFLRSPGNDEAKHIYLRGQLWGAVRLRGIMDEAMVVLTKYSGDPVPDDLSGGGESTVDDEQAREDSAAADT